MLIPLRQLPGLFLFPLFALAFAGTGSGSGPSSVWWSFRPPVKEPLPEGFKADHPIDAFIRAELNSKGLEASPEADRHTLIRRLYLVMLGLPPSPDEVASFVDDPSATDEAWNRQIDRVLSDPRYGERWAQHWLDIIRWAETVGFETNAPRPHAWRYRDWVIDSLNADKPYNEFLFEQLAGDTVEADAALGFLVAGPANLPGQIGRDEEAMRQARQDELDEVIRTVSQSILGLTIGCARCHDHKFDPISARDYYSMQAIFSGLSYGNRRLRGPENDAMAARVPALETRLSQLQTRLERFRNNHQLKVPLADSHSESFPPVLARSIRMRIEETRLGGAPSLYELEAWSSQSAEDPTAHNVALASKGAKASASSFALENQTRHPDCLNDGSVDKRQAFPWRAGQGGKAWARIDLARPTVIDRLVWHAGYSHPAAYVLEYLEPGSENWKPIAHARNRLPHRNDRRPATRMDLEGVSPSEVAELVTLLTEIRSTSALRDQNRTGPQVYAARFSERPEPTWILNRGNPLQRTEQVPPTIPAALGRLDLPSQSPEPERRIAFARHVTVPDHPLTTRVIVNRIWQHHFGTGLVATPSDFGEMGSRPSHPRLLDWLAVTFARQGQSLKNLHRLILTSRTFRQGSQPETRALATDAESRLLWRFPPRRVEAEVIRDSILTASGQLNPKRGGVGFDFFVQKGGLADYQAHTTFGEDGWRRMVYARKIRMQAVDIFG
ncbi:MAG: DUF1549 and DUF1553 domain-containing protein, partial [Verrucomicrobiota bacterium]